MRVSDVNTEFVDKATLQHLINELKVYINKVASGEIDLADYVTKEELQSKLDALEIDIDLSSYATKEELENAINDIDLSSYATQTYVDDKFTEYNRHIITHADIDALFS